MKSATSEIPQVDQSEFIREFAARSKNYYEKQFNAIQSGDGDTRALNFATLAFGPIWAAARGMWSVFWVCALIEIVALVQLGRGLWGDLGADKTAEAAQLLARSEEMRLQAGAAAVVGDSTAQSSMEIANNLQLAAEAALLEAQADAGSEWIFLLIGAILLLAVRFGQAYFANRLYEEQYSKWRVNKSTPFGFSIQRLVFGVLLLLIMLPMTLYRFTASKPVSWVLDVPIDTAYRTATTNWLDGWFDRTADSGKEVFDAITSSFELLLDGIEVLLVDAPWPVVVIFLSIIAWRAAGLRVAIFTVGSLAYIGVLGLWEAAMISIVLVGAASLVCILIGIPLGVWFSRSERAYVFARPVLDLMQTIPPFVYLIPIIAFFGTGRVPGVLATIIFAMPPVIRLTTLGLRQVPPDIKEAARAFGATQWQVLKGVELPLATPSIMTGVNQTILFSLSMVVIASLIGAKGLGQEVLLSLQLIAKGQGILAGLAILFCAMMLDRIVQGRFKREQEDL